MEENAQAQYTRAQMLDDGRRVDPAVNEALLGHYVDLGLVDKAQPGGRGRGGGKGGHWTWSAQQHDLWLLLLEKRRQVQVVRRLANLPIAIWLLYGGEHVPLRQVRRALSTYAHVGLKPARADYGKAARVLVRQLARTRAYPLAKQALIDLLVDSARSRELDEEAAAKLLDEVVGPADPSQQFDGPRAFFLLRAKWAARTRLNEISDDQLRWGREVYRYTRGLYPVVRAQLAADPRFGAMHQPVDLDAIVNNAAEDVLTILGMALTGPPSEGSPLPAAPAAA